MAPLKKAPKSIKLKSLVRRRSNIIGAAQLIKRFDDDFIEEQRGQLPVRIERLEELFREFEHIQDEIEDLEDELEEFCDQRRELHNLYYELKSSLQSKLSSGQFAHNPTSNNQTDSAPPIANVRLPEIRLSEFSGEFGKWEAFRDLFTSLIHNNSSLPAVQKMHYLRGALTGEASRIISSLEISSVNYTIAWKLLKERFENSNFLIKNHMAGLLSATPLKKESSSGLSELADEFDRHVQLLDKLENPEVHWNSFLVERLSQCLDPASLREWETTNSTTVRPTYKQLLEFIHKRSRLIQTLMLSQNNPSHSEPPKPSKSRLTTAHVASDNIPRCVCCKRAHFLFQCSQFTNDFTPRQRFEMVKKNGLCINCMKGTHLAKDCSSGSCKTCSKKHHTLLHLPPFTPHGQQTSQRAAIPSQSCLSQLESSAGSSALEQSHASPPANSSPASDSIPPTSSRLTLNSDSLPPTTACQSAEVKSNSGSFVMLSTAVIKVLDADNKYQFARALLDSGSQPSFISESLCQRLRLKRNKLNSPVSGIGQSSVNVHFGVTLSIASRFGGFETSLQCLVLPKLTVDLPSHHIDVTRWRIPRHLPLADPQFNIRQGIDLILGAELFFDLLQQQRFSLPSGYPSLQKTVLGFIVCGKVSAPAPLRDNTLTSHVCSDEALNVQLERFWEVENFDDGKALTTEELSCEEHFKQTVQRDDSGRYVVRLPMRTEMVSLLGDSYAVALRRFKSMERKFAADENLRQAYVNSMADYEKLGHMEVNLRASCSPQFFLPHHAIHRPESTTTKIRVVFDGSCRGSTHLCLNDVLYTGHSVQPALYATVINFRMPLYVVTADIEKMFRQIWVHPEDRKFQQILWRARPSEPISTYTLNTVTYGLASSPFHATRILEQLAADEGKYYPLAAQILRNGTYMDDILTGHNDPKTLEDSCHELIEMLSKAGFVLRKFATNNQSILSKIPSELWELKNVLELDRTAAIKTLGLLWFPHSDSLRFKVPVLPESSGITKRIVVSEMAQLFDPLGLLSPVVMQAKMFVQRLWAEHLPWDTELAEDLSIWWKQYRRTLQRLLDIEIPRRVIGNTHHQYTLHCFCDASKGGYGCSIYVVSPDLSGTLQSRLLTSKSRVASLKGHSIPRYELCAALLGSQLVDNLRKTTVYTQPAIFWSDSTIVLYWIKSPSHKWKVFVSNRIAEIQRLTKDCQWRHIPTELNPADKVSRGVLASEIVGDELWWHGPGFRTSPVEQWPDSKVCVENFPEQDCEAQVVVSLHSQYLETSLIDRTSELAKLLKIVAFFYRFQNNCRLEESKRYKTSLTPSEIDHALKVLIRMVQRSTFHLEMQIYDLKRTSSSTKTVSSKSPLKNLNLFMDEFGLLRLNSRLTNRNAPFDTRCPILLPAKHRLSWLIARSIHLQTFHGGPGLVLATLRQRFWPLQGRVLVRSIVRQCITCFRCNPTRSTQMMAPLPAVRVTPAKVFAYTGLDYCGPFNVRPLSGRGSSVKMYVALFVCFVVKAVHLEVVADLTSVACINAIKRFVATRGRVCEIHCDNATAFVGADRELRALRRQFLQQFKTPDWDKYSLDSGITFRFIPARSPHFGGLWEAGIKSFKYHFRRIVGQKSYNVDHFLTIVTQTQAILNSRPIASHPDHPQDLEPLTPGHLLIGEPLISIAEPDITDLNPNRLNRLQDMKRTVQDFWRRWARDYTSQLHQRSKWKQPSSNVQVGQLVLLQQDNLPVLQWPLGRVEKIFPGNDGRVRAVLVRTAQGQYKRGVTEISILPIDPDEDEGKVTTDEGLSEETQLNVAVQRRPEC
ncbi:uncharacterized protein LOC129741345 [Uranotaenia lowii]|uniref:uncharacterized protein LOC129741345 n=1 Tax=Uranotaenia lowii TaxID=190385 RepID=UPI002478E386|nr:uncharacterized protein LOC129741345 [Uranotaenia lowii]